jgi:hypothetical protein
MPRETTGLVLFIGVATGLFWGALSTMAIDTTVWPPLVAPLWVTSLIAARVSVNPLLVGALVSALCGLSPVAGLFWIARLRGA